MFENIRADIRRARKVNGGAGWWKQHVSILLMPETLVVLNHRLLHWIHCLRNPVLRVALKVMVKFPTYLLRASTGVWISPRAEIGPGFVVHTLWGVHIAPTRIGRDCVVQSGVVFRHGIRQIGDKVYFGAGAKVMAPVTIGNNVTVSANSVVITDIPDNTSVLGVPARIRWPRRFGFAKRPPSREPAKTAARSLPGEDPSAANEPSPAPAVSRAK